MSRYIDKDAFVKSIKPIASKMSFGIQSDIANAIVSAPSIEIVRCKECRHRPIKADSDGANYGFNLIAPNDLECCPCLVEDGWYSWMPDDNFYCGYGERREP